MSPQQKKNNKPMVVVPSMVQQRRGSSSAVSDISESFVPQLESLLDTTAAEETNRNVITAALSPSSTKYGSATMRLPQQQQETVEDSPAVPATTTTDSLSAQRVAQVTKVLPKVDEAPSMTSASTMAATVSCAATEHEDSAVSCTIVREQSSSLPEDSFVVPAVETAVTTSRTASERCSATTTTIVSSASGQILPTFKAQSSSVILPTEMMGMESATCAADANERSEDDEPSTAVIHLYKPTGEAAVSATTPPPRASTTTTAGAVVVRSDCPKQQLQRTRNTSCGAAEEEQYHYCTAEAPAILVPVQHVAIPNLPAAPVEERQQEGRDNEKQHTATSALSLWIRRRRQQVVLVAGLVIVLLLVSTTVLGVCVATGRCQSSNKDDEGRPSSANVAAAADYTPTPERIQTLQALASRLAAPQEDDSVAIAYPPTRGTPQEYALEWLLDTDPLQLAVGSSGWIQRYVLAVAAFAWGYHAALLNGRDTCSWEGIKGCVDGDATQLVWSQRELTGSLPYELVHLSRLAVLSLADNRLTGSIPEAWSDVNEDVWPVLEQVDVGGNQLTGPLPSWGNSNSNGNVLRMLDASENFFTGRLPLEYTRWTNMERFSVQENALTGSIPEGYAQSWRYLQVFSVFGNGLTGRLPEEIDSWTDLMVLEVNNNRLSGDIPEGLTTASNIQSVFLYGNDMTGIVNCNNVSANVVADCNKDDVTCSCCSLCCPGSSWC